LALGVAIVQTVLPLLGARFRDPQLADVAIPAAQMQFVLAAIAFVALTVAYVTSGRIRTRPSRCSTKFRACGGTTRARWCCGS
jgi:cytochrome c biogenesis factor